MRHLLISSSVIFLLAAHCSGSTATDDDSGLTDASTDATVDGPDDSSTNETSTADASDSAAADYCSTFTTHENSCGFTDACALAREAQCPTEVTFRSAQFLTAYVTCGTKFECTDAGVDGGGLAFRQCVAAALSPDPVAQTLSQHVCASCASSGQQTQCQQNFYSATNGVALLEYDDAVLGDIDNACGAVDAGNGGDAGVCIATFTACSDAVLKNTLPARPATCTDN